MKRQHIELFCTQVIESRRPKDMEEWPELILLRSRTICIAMVVMLLSSKAFSHMILREII